LGADDNIEYDGSGIVFNSTLNITLDNSQSSVSLYANQTCNGDDWCLYPIEFTSTTVGGLVLSSLLTSSDLNPVTLNGDFETTGELSYSWPGGGLENVTVSDWRIYFKGDKDNISIQISTTTAGYDAVVSNQTVDARYSPINVSSVKTYLDFLPTSSTQVDVAPLGQTGTPSTTSSTPYEVFDGWESGTIDGAVWSTTSSNEGRVRILTTQKHTGTYSLAMDDSVDGSAVSLNQLITEDDFTGADIVNISFWLFNSNDEPNGGSDHTGTQNADAYYFTCDGTQWYHLEDIASTDITWVEFDVIVSDDPDWCGTADSNFAIKFTQYDNYEFTQDGFYFDDINISWAANDVVSGGGTPFWNFSAQSENHTTDIYVNYYEATYEDDFASCMTLKASTENGNTTMSRDGQEVLDFTIAEAAAGTQKGIWNFLSLSSCTEGGVIDFVANSLCSDCVLTKDYDEWDGSTYS